MAAAAVARPVPKPRGRVALRAVPAPRMFHSVQEIDNSRVKRVSDPREGRTLMLYVAISVLVFLGLLGLAWEQFAIVKAGYEINDLKAKREQLVEDNKTLGSQIALLSKPERVTNYATVQLGLTQPKQSQVVRFDTPLPSPEGEPVLARLHPYGGKP